MTCKQCGPTYSVDRREWLKSNALGFGYLALASMLGEESRSVAEDAPARDRPKLNGPETRSFDPLASKQPHFEARAKRIIFLFMKGGPSHVDTFDYKPLLQRDHGKPLPFDKPRVQFAKTGTLLKSPWSFQQYGELGIHVSELFPHTARHVDEMCFIHSVHGTNAAHGGALLKLHTGSDNFVRPSMGAWVTYGLGTENHNLPGFVTICPTLAHGGVNNWSSAFLPAAYQGTPIGNASVPADKARVKYISNAGSVPEEAQRLQLEIMSEINRQHLARTGSNRELEGRINTFELAFRMQTEMPQVENILDETESTRRLYGLDNPVTANFGHQCLLARRFAERGVRFVQVTHSDAFVQWDQHSDLKNGHEKNAKEVDLPIAGLLTDLKQRGLLKDTLVLWSGEFGRTPTVEGSNGRDHNPEGFTVWCAGGGVKPGFRYGATDDYGYFAAQDKVHIHDLHATLLHALGLNHERLTFRHAGREFRLTDVYGNVVHPVFA